MSQIRGRIVVNHADKKTELFYLISIIETMSISEHSGQKC